ncbi:hypothetical protein ACFFS4_24660 [Kutzneria kofuensis]|uniref:Transposase-like protein n=2 Tax=Kutzneria kofuensis TaxID=103725 RepID=A0A7W9NL58_9PSEU|nr:hypothetical protein [Kutzneria kofuensis]MBB5896106.1 transposase-like protein [Kutzneria kofuensis]
MHPSRPFYGIAEIADALGLARQLVTVWRKRRSHGMPEPDAELASGPIWQAATVEPWIEQMRDRLGADTVPSASPELARRAARRMLRLAVLLLEDTPRAGPLARALHEARELLPQVAECAPDELGKALRELLAPVDGPAQDPASPDDQRSLRARVLGTVPIVSRVVELVTF